MEQVDPEIVKILRSKTPRERCEMAFAANRLVRERLRAHLRHEHPDWSDDRIRAEIARRMLWTSAAEEARLGVSELWRQMLEQGDE